MVRPRGFEPLTQWLKAICSTNWAKSAFWCPELELNQHDLRSRDFKSLASTYSATWAITFFIINEKNIFVSFFQKFILRRYFLAFINIWCPKQDLNLHDFSVDFESTVSTIPPFGHIYYYTNNFIFCIK